MKHLFVLIHCLMLCASNFAQKKPAEFYKIETAILEEGIKLYQLETAQTLGLQAFREQLRRLADSTEGYFSYKDANVFRCVFFSKGFDAHVVAR